MKNVRSLLKDFNKKINHYNNRRKFNHDLLDNVDCYHDLDDYYLMEVFDRLSENSKRYARTFKG